MRKVLHLETFSNNLMMIIQLPHYIFLTLSLIFTEDHSQVHDKLTVTILQGIIHFFHHFHKCAKNMEEDRDQRPMYTWQPFQGLLKTFSTFFQIKVYALEQEGLGYQERINNFTSL